jgi:hypothetical protein
MTIPVLNPILKGFQILDRKFSSELFGTGMREAGLEIYSPRW